MFVGRDITDQMSRPASFGLGLGRRPSPSCRGRVSPFDRPPCRFVPWNLLDRRRDRRDSTASDELEAQAGGGGECGGCGTVGRAGSRSWFASRSWRDARTRPAAPKSQAPSFPGISIKVGALDDAAILAGVVSPTGRVGGITPRRHSDPRRTGHPGIAVANIDVVLFPAQRLGDLVNAGVLAPIPNAAVLPPKPAEDEHGNQDRRDRPIRPRPLWTTRFSTWTSRRPFASMSANMVPSGSLCRAGVRPWCSSIAAMRSRAHPTARRRGRRGCRWNSRRQPGRSLTPSPSSFRAATGMATVRPTTASRWCSVPTPRGSATRPFWREPPAWGCIATITRSCSMPTT